MYKHNLLELYPSDSYWDGKALYLLIATISNKPCKFNDYTLGNNYIPQRFRVLDNIICKPLR